MSLGIHELDGKQHGYTPTGMEWRDVQRHFRTERKRRHLTQEAVAVSAKIDQSTVSKIERDPNYNAEVQTFLNAVEGLGLTPSEFFAAVESGQHTRSQNPALRQVRESDKTPPLVVEGEAEAAAAISGAVVLDTKTLLRGIGRALRDAARHRQAPAARKRKA